MRNFSIIWFGQLVSKLGSGLTGFALGVWMFQNTGSVTRYALIVMCAALPAPLLSPVAGALVDRWDRRRTMILSDTIAAVSTLVIALLLTAGGLEIWHIYLLTTVNAASSAFQVPAFSASTTLLVPKRHLVRAGGMVSASPTSAFCASALSSAWRTSGRRRNRSAGIPTSICSGNSGIP